MANPEFAAAFVMLDCDRHATHEIPPPDGYAPGFARMAKTQGAAIFRSNMANVGRRLAI
jgi:hypothetical protein